MRKLTIACVLALIAAPAMAVVSIPLDAQINIGGSTPQSPSGNAIYPAINADTQTFFPGSHVRHNMVALDPATGKANWWYQYVDFTLAGYGQVNAAGGAFEFDTRYYQDAESNAKPYADAPVFLRAYSYADDGSTLLGYRDYSIVYATQAPWNNPPAPAWTHVVVPVAGGTTTNAFDETKISRIRWYGTDWQGTGFDYVDFKNLTVTPEPASLMLLVLGGVAVLRRRR